MEAEDGESEVENDHAAVGNKIAEWVNRAAERDLSGKLTVGGGRRMLPIDQIGLPTGLSNGLR